MKLEEDLQTIRQLKETSRKRNESASRIINDLETKLFELEKAKVE